MEKWQTFKHAQNSPNLTKQTKITRLTISTYSLCSLPTFILDSSAVSSLLPHFSSHYNLLLILQLHISNFLIIIPYTVYNQESSGEFIANSFLGVKILLKTWLQAMKLLGKKTAHTHTKTSYIILGDGFLLMNS